jgi:Zn finger protein HypA/HybF involved in hydrogenase expression
MTNKALADMKDKTARTAGEIESFSDETEFYCLSCGQDFKPVTDETLCERCSRQEHGDLLHCR